MLQWPASEEKYRTDAPQLQIPWARGHADAKQRSIKNPWKLDLAPPAETRVLPIQIRDGLVVQSSKLGIDVLLVTLAVVQLHVEHQSDAQD